MVCTSHNLEKYFTFDPPCISRANPSSTRTCILPINVWYSSVIIRIVTAAANIVIVDCGETYIIIINRGEPDITW